MPDSRHPLTISSAEIADALGCSEATFMKKWRRMNRESGFPRPLPHCPSRWSLALVTAWMSTNGNPDVMNRAEHRQPPNVIEMQRAELERRYVEQAA